MKDRIDVFTNILKYASDHHIRLNRFWGSFVETARYKLGESIKDIKIPFSLDSDTTESIQTATDDLIELLKKRIEAQFKAAEDRSIDDFTTRVKPGPKTFQIRFFKPGSLEHTIISNCLQTDPFLDAGLLEPWLQSKDSGQKFLALAHGVINKAFIEEIKSESLEKTAYITLLSLIKQIVHEKNLIKRKTIKGIKYEQIDVTLANIFYQCLKAILEKITDQLRKKRIPSDLTHTFLLMLSTCHPLIFTSIKPAITSNRINPYRLPQAIIALFDPIYRDVSQKDTDLKFVFPNMIERILNHEDIKRVALEEGLLLHLRILMVEFLSYFDNPNVPLMETFRNLCQDAQFFEQTIYTPKTLATLLDNVKANLKIFEKDDERISKLQDLEGILKFIHKGGGWKNPSWAKDTLQHLVSLYLFFKIDLYLDQFTQEAFNLLDNRQTKFSVQQLKNDYENGRLYRISADAYPTLKEFSEKFEGQLFIDLKDFTKRTNFAKEIAVAEFLENEFYKPIITASQKYVDSRDDSNRNIKLVNLLGDAVIFSGSIESLVYLAQDIQNIFKDYANKLKSQSPVNLEKESKNRLNNLFQKNIVDLKSTISETEKKINLLETEIREKLKTDLPRLQHEIGHRLGQEIQALENEFLNLDSQMAEEAETQKRYEIGGLKNDVTQRITTLRGMQKQYAQQFKSMRPDMQTQFIAHFFFRSLFEEIATLKEQLDFAKKKENQLQYDYEKELKKIEGFGMDAGLFISYGKAAEVIAMTDEVWGVQKVFIAESINESARGTARNSMIKSFLDARLNEQIRLRGRPDLSFPFHVFVEKSFSFQLSAHKSAEFNHAIKGNNLAKVEQVLHNLFYEGLRDARELIQNKVLVGEKRTLTTTRDIYNEGHALSEEALNAFIKETAANRFHVRRSFPVRKFHQQILDQFLFLNDHFRFVMSVSNDSPKNAPLIFRFAGSVTFRGFENRGAIGIYELLKLDSPFYQLIVKHHRDEWLSENHPQSPE